MRTESRTIMSAISSASVAVASARTKRFWSRERKLPAGTSNGACLSAAATSVTVRPKLVKRRGSVETRRTRWRLPESCTSATPSTAMSRGMTSFSTIWVRASIVSTSLVTATFTTGSASSLALTTITCSTRSGSRRATRLTASRTSAAAVSRSTPGRNSIYMRPKFSSEPAQIFRIPETRATAPSRTLTTSASMVSGEAPG